MKSLKKNKVEKKHLLSPEKRRLLDLNHSLPWGAHATIANLAGCTKGHVSNVLNGRLKTQTELFRRVIKIAENMDKRDPQSGTRRTYLINGMRHGDQVLIARKVGCSPQKVSAVLNGHHSQISHQGTNIIRLAERYEERERLRKRWNRR